MMKKRNMESRRAGPRWLRILLWVLLVLNMAVIFAFSSRERL